MTNSHGALTPRRLGIGLISAGWMGRLHSRAYLAVPDKYADLGVIPELVIVADPVKANTDAARRQFGYREATADYRDVLAHPAVQAVSICAPNYLHREFALAAAGAGKPFWIEKPMGVSAAQAADVAQVADAAGLVTAVGFTYRQAPAVEYAKKLIAEGAIGRVTNIHCKFDADYSADPRGARTWRFELAKAGAGVLGDLLSHGFDLAQYLVGSPVSAVSAMTETFVKERPEPGAGTGHGVQVSDDARLLPVENEDYAAVLARFASGVVATFESTRVGVGSRCDYGVQVHGTAGAIGWNFERLNEIAICSAPSSRDYGYARELSDHRFGDFARFQPGAGMGLSFDDLKTIEGARFIQSVTSGSQLAPSVADALATSQIAAAAQQSVKSGAWVSVPAPTGKTTFDR
ncbi:MAG: Gfo/Idh/MocA family oxidoreductase [Bifidobacteriaceae bacterium]|jgi:predicted dehydrogenase|nr:Gfo/Idh/MocA family oxidoreductase [Bifidobacteriaceae bacterium]